MSNPIYPLNAHQLVSKFLILDWEADSTVNNYLPTVFVPVGCLRLDLHIQIRSSYVGATTDQAKVEFNKDVTSANYFSAFHYGGTSHGAAGVNNNNAFLNIGNTNAAFTYFHAWMFTPSKRGSGYVNGLNFQGSVWRPDGYWAWVAVCVWSLGRPIDVIDIGLVSGNIVTGCTYQVFATMVTP